MSSGCLSQDNSTLITLLQKNNTELYDIKFENDIELIINRNLLDKSNTLILNKTKCTGCGICVKVCPTETIEMKLVSLVKNSISTQSMIDFNESTCTYCGICSNMCPMDAICI